MMCGREAKLGQWAAETHQVPSELKNSSIKLVLNFFLSFFMKRHICIAVQYYSLALPTTQLLTHSGANKNFLDVNLSIEIFPWPSLTIGQVLDFLTKKFSFSIIISFFPSLYQAFSQVLPK